MRANETAVRGLIPINSLMTSLNNSSISMIWCGMSRREKCDEGEQETSVGVRARRSFAGRVPPNGELSGTGNCQAGTNPVRHPGGIHLTLSPTTTMSFVEDHWVVCRNETSVNGSRSTKCAKTAQYNHQSRGIDVDLPSRLLRLSPQPERSQSRYGEISMNATAVILNPPHVL